MTRGNGGDRDVELSGSPFPRAPRRVAGNEAAHAIRAAGWSVAEVLEATTDATMHYRAEMEAAGEAFDAESFAFGYIVALIAVGRGQRDQASDPS